MIGVAEAIPPELRKTMNCSSISLRFTGIVTADMAAQECSRYLLKKVFEPVESVWNGL